MKNFIKLWTFTVSGYMGARGTRRQEYPWEYVDAAIQSCGVRGYLIRSSDSTWKTASSQSDSLLEQTPSDRLLWAFLRVRFSSPSCGTSSLWFSQSGRPLGSIVSRFFLVDRLHVRSLSRTGQPYAGVCQRLDEGTRSVAGTLKKTRTSCWPRSGPTPILISRRKVTWFFSKGNTGTMNSI